MKILGPLARSVVAFSWAHQRASAAFQWVGRGTFPPCYCCHWLAGGLDWSGCHSQAEEQPRGNGWVTGCTAKLSPRNWGSTAALSHASNMTPSISQLLLPKRKTSLVMLSFYVLLWRARFCHWNQFLILSKLMQLISQTPPKQLALLLAQRGCLLHRRQLDLVKVYLRALIHDMSNPSQYARYPIEPERLYSPATPLIPNHARK